ncbi:MAG: hypothetical protein CVU44_01185 [Chloroflexi bacterium HGW-Chloroflexi-6]|nr:MAG: hypothetical protein CVU44_01185 [Chloroflexi bacterium HGW-Chloroflexi-6]
MSIGWIILACIIIGLIAIEIFMLYRIYKKNVAAVEVYKNGITIQPSKSRFIISLSIFYAALEILVLIVLWLLPIDRVVFYVSLCFFPAIVIINFFLAYPYYTVIIHDSKLSGATLWGWMWKRTEINLKEIDKDKALRQNLGRIFGITAIESADGTKILTLGLDNLQIRKILEFTSENL